VARAADYFIGLDLGQSHDFTGIAIVERAELRGAWDPVVFAFRKRAALRLRYLERVALGTPYPEVATRVKKVAASVEALGRCYLAADATGVGRPVVDLLRREGLGRRLWPAVITGGEWEGQEKGYYRVPKRDLIVGLQVLLQGEALQIASGLPFREALAGEMAAMQVKVTARGRERYGAWREGEHDDLVLAVALACWMGRKIYPRRLTGEDGWWVGKAE
jgi:hypothetical protein